MIRLSRPVGRNQPNQAEDVQQIRDRLVQIKKLVPSPDGTREPIDSILLAIGSVQDHFMLQPDLVVSPGGRTVKILDAWEVKPVSPGVQLPGTLQLAWDLVNPLLPKGSYCSSGFRSAADQKRILHKFFNIDFKGAIIAKFGLVKYNAAAADLTKNEEDVLAMVRGVGQQIARPGASMHQQGKAVDIGGPNDDRQVEVVKIVARANPGIFSGKVLKERNGCVHFETR